MISTLICAECVKVVLLRMNVKDVGDEDFGEVVSDFIGRPSLFGGVGLIPATAEIVSILRGEFDDPGLGEHFEKLEAGGANEGLLDCGLSLAPGFTDEDDRGHSFSSASLVKLRTGVLGRAVS